VGGVWGGGDVAVCCQVPCSSLLLCSSLNQHWPGTADTVFFVTALLNEPSVPFSLLPHAHTCILLTQQMSEVFQEAGPGNLDIGGSEPASH
jgi:hypothetical protein